MADRIKSYKLSPQLRAEIGSAKRFEPRLNIDFSAILRIRLPWRAIGSVAAVFVLIIAGYIGVKKGYEAIAERSRQAQATREQEYKAHLAQIKSEVAARATDAYSYAVLGQEYLKNNDVERAQAAAELATDRDPKWRDAYVNLGQIYLSSNQFEKARDTFKKALELDPTNGEIHYFLSLTYQELRNSEAAKQEFTRAKELGFNSDIGG